MVESSKVSIPLKRLAVAGALALAMTALPASGSLGGDAASIQADQLHMQGTRTMRAAGSYTVHEIQGENGTKVREYIAADGKVFALAWNGPWFPDMKQILGTYFDQYSRASQAQRTTRIRRGPVMINEAGLIVQIGGHMRAFAGRAYVPGMLPAGVSAENIQ
jgi:Protein of unknown function (DUF2844)